MEKAQLSIKPREGKGKGAAHAMRRAGKIPGVVYGAGDPLPIELDRREFEKTLRSGGRSTVITLKAEGQGDRRAVIKEYQHDPVTGGIIHADLVEVSSDRPLHVTVPVTLAGNPAGIRGGGILEHLTRELEVECLPDSMPDRIEIDISALEIADTIHVSDIRFPDGVRPLTPPEQVVVSLAPSVVAGKPEEAVSPEATAKQAEPEVIKKPGKEAA